MLISVEGLASLRETLGWLHGPEHRSETAAAEQDIATGSTLFVDEVRRGPSSRR